VTLFAKLWTDVLDDPKLQRAARKGARHLVLLPWLIVFAKRADDDGRLTVNGEPAEPEDIARSVPNASTKQVEGALRELEGIGVLYREDDQALRFAQWDRRAETKPSASPSAVAERVRRHRERKRLADVARTDGALQGVTSNDGGNTGNAFGNATERRAESKSGEQERERRAESEVDTRAPLAAAASTPAALTATAAELLTHVPERKRDAVRREMQQVLNGGCPHKGGLVRATTNRLDAKCRDTLTAIDRGLVRNNPWAYALAKLADTSDGSAPGAIAAERDRQDRDDDPYLNVEHRDRVTFGERKARADAIAAGQPAHAGDIAARALKAFPRDAAAQERYAVDELLKLDPAVSP
jgi:hypothetical protein